MSDPYTLRYVELSPSRIFNWLAPENVTCWLNVPQWRNTWWEPETVEKRTIFASIWTLAFDEITGHFSALRKSIEQNGVQRPISTVSGAIRGRLMTDGIVPGLEECIPPEYRKDASELIYTQPFGGSRLSLAVELGIEKIPCVVHDFSNLFPDAVEVTRRNYGEFFGNDYTFVDQAPNIINRQHIHMDTKSKYISMNQNTRVAQRKATEIAKRELNV